MRTESCTLVSAFDDDSFIYAGDAPLHFPYEGIKGVTLTMSYAINRRR